jgi:hypothetical protein
MSGGWVRKGGEGEKEGIFIGVLCGLATMFIFIRLRERQCCESIINRGLKIKHLHKGQTILAGVIIEIT